MLKLVMHMILLGTEPECTWVNTSELLLWLKIGITRRQAIKISLRLLIFNLLLLNV